jgi:hypothetical protein
MQFCVRVVVQGERSNCVLIFFKCLLLIGYRKILGGRFLKKKLKKAFSIKSLEK